MRWWTATVQVPENYGPVMGVCRSARNDFALFNRVSREDLLMPLRALHGGMFNPWILD
ncbi:hypothetical protein [Candidatus Villigracilis saccharophilus]|uniref:hypothetical protein n=1 Tax=Candidatus Villigracilis saccharophilus TaxID=3140684 RepID=UPI00313570B9|nr:hypothetical protein [Anaerolineales bacterium]